MCKLNYRLPIKTNKTLKKGVGKAGIGTVCVWLLLLVIARIAVCFPRAKSLLFAMAAKEVAKTVLVLGKCVPTPKENVVKVAISRFERNQYLNIFFKKVQMVYAQDKQKLSRVGDVVLLEKMPEKISTLIEHRVKEVVFPLGDVTDPITGKKVVHDQYRDDIKETNKRFGEVESAFDYDKAPPRGWQEGKKDFTSKPVYKKYHVFEDDDQPYGRN